MFNRYKTILKGRASIIMVQLIDKIATEKSFGVSSDKKVPLNVKPYLTTLNVRDIRPVTSDDLNNHNLATLNEINMCPSFNKTNRAYHMHAASNLIIGFDIEPRCWSNYLAYFARLPAHYREYSMHNGIHLLYQLNRQKLIPAANDMLAERTEYKFKDMVNNEPLEYELMLNNHWLTLTRRIFGKQDDLETPVPEVIYQLINQEALHWSQNKQQLHDIAIDKQASELAKKITNLADINKLNDLKGLTVADFHDDDSLYEHNIAIRIAGMLYYRLYISPKPMDTMYLKCMPRLVSKTDFIWATAILLKQIVPAREKDNELRDGLPWLVYTAKKACLYIIADNES